MDPTVIGRLKEAGCAVERSPSGRFYLVAAAKGGRAGWDGALMLTAAAWERALCQWDTDEGVDALLDELVDAASSVLPIPIVRATIALSEELPGPPPDELDAIVPALLRICGDAPGAIAWLKAPQPTMGGRTPLAVIAAGDASAVLDHVALIVNRRRAGRPAKHLDHADRQAAYRERQALAAAEGEAAKTLIAKPTPAFVLLMVKRLLDQAQDPAAAKAALLGQLAGVAPTE